VRAFLRILTFVLAGPPVGTLVFLLARRMQPGWAYRWWVTLAGGIAGFVGTSWFAIPNGFGDGRPGSAVVFLALTGAAAGFVSILVFDGLSHVRARTAVA
jgi:hypothetical protein